MHVRRITSLNEAFALASRWNLLTRNVPFRGWEWLSSWHNHFGADGELCLIVAEDDRGELLGLAPWRLHSHGLRGRVLEFLGSGSVCSDYLSLLSTVEHEDAVVAQIAQWLVEAARGPEPANRWDLLELSGVAAADGAVVRLTDRLQEAGCAVYRRAGLNCWRIELPQTWEEYVGGLSKSHRKQVRRLERRLNETDDAVLRTAHGPEQVGQGMRILVDLHQRRRRSLGQPGCFADRRFHDFLHEAAERLAERDSLRLHWLELHGKPVAAEFHLVGGDGVYAYQAGVDPDSLDEEPGRLITVATIQHAIEEGRRWFDFLRGDEPYKAHFRASPVECVETHVAAPRAASQIRHGVWAAGDAMKLLIKSSLGLAGTS